LAYNLYHDSIGAPFGFLWVSDNDLVFGSISLAYFEPVNSLVLAFLIEGERFHIGFVFPQLERREIVHA